MRTLLFAAALGVAGSAWAQAPAGLDYWMQYDGADLVQGQHACAAPSFPQRSETRRDIRRLNDQYNAWVACHDAAAGHLAAVIPAGKAVPAPVLAALTEPQRQELVAHLEQVYTAVAATLDGRADATMHEYQRWRQGTEAYVRQASRAGEAPGTSRRGENDVAQHYRDSWLASQTSITPQATARTGILR